MRDKSATPRERQRLEEGEEWWRGGWTRRHKDECLLKGEYSTAGRQTQTPSLRNVKMKLTNNCYGRFHRDDNWGLSWRTRFMKQVHWIIWITLLCKTLSSPCSTSRFYSAKAPRKLSKPASWRRAQVWVKHCTLNCRKEGNLTLRIWLICSSLWMKKVSALLSLSLGCGKHGSRKSPLTCTLSGTDSPVRDCALSCTYLRTDRIKRCKCMRQFTRAWCKIYLHLELTSFYLGNLVRASPGCLWDLSPKKNYNTHLSCCHMLPPHHALVLHSK